MKWGGIIPEFYCTSCGIVIDHPGMPYPHINLKDAIDFTFNAIGQQKIPIKPFIMTLNSTTGVHHDLSVSQLDAFGYSIKNGYITRKD